MRVMLRNPAGVVAKVLGGLEQAQAAGVDLGWGNLVDQAREDAEPERTLSGLNAWVLLVGNAVYSTVCLST
jgi:hypothetical protein